MSDIWDSLIGSLLAVKGLGNHSLPALLPTAHKDCLVDLGWFHFTSAALSGIHPIVLALLRSWGLHCSWGYSFINGLSTGILTLPRVVRPPQSCISYIFKTAPHGWCLHPSKSDFQLDVYPCPFASASGYWPREITFLLSQGVLKISP